MDATLLKDAIPRQGYGVDGDTVWGTTRAVTGHLVFSPSTFLMPVQFVESEDVATVRMNCTTFAELISINTAESNLA